MTSELVNACAHALSADGVLARGLEGFAFRESQQQLSTEIAEAIEDRAVLVAEAGTGTGKTFAYLVPALLSGKRVIISTGTKALQEQLYHRDLPRIKKALGTPVHSALLKGRANYLCQFRLEQAKSETFASRDAAQHFQRVLAWAGKTQRGDLAELSSIPEDSPIWPQVSSTADNCLGGECPFWSECHLVKARQQAQSADVVVVNHHLLLADLAIKQEGFGEVLPGASVFILDEAHQVPELALQFFGDSVSTRQWLELGKDVLLEAGKISGSSILLAPTVKLLELRVKQLRAECEAVPGKGAAALLRAKPAVIAAMDALQTDAETLLEALRQQAGASAALDQCTGRAEILLQRWRLWLTAARREAEAGDETTAPAAAVRWYELSPRGITLNATPMDVSTPLRQYREQSQAAWILTSATLAVNRSVSHLAAKLGLDEPRVLVQPSPFDWQNQGLFYLPKGMPEPSHPQFIDALLEHARPVLEASKGRAFLLFTSHRALKQAAQQLEGGPWPLFVQGTAPRMELLARFRESGNGVLLGAASFWEGVDVAGEALSLVVIDKLPFAAPDDPVLEARLEAVRQRGGNPFAEEQIPSAVIALKQGAGRLIRSVADRGVLMMGDTRLVSKPYGRIFIQSLPPFPRTRELDDVREFFARVPA
ncbi:helicase [Arenimonas maotaiensis]|uniref:DNA 5'-3' helicase n=1 Tax=Arenimonas maotaiensis TaxID=1446479 RepID=A0A917FIY8_9GAMM|nr:ATP-dependent DNA helicase [Arenimonas maotaiensis]GGF86602.1 helicase [Arenimonas maotaiensis]